MVSGTSSLDTLKDIRKMMDRSSRFISLSGWSGIIAGVCGVAGAIFAHNLINDHRSAPGSGGIRELEYSLLMLAAAVFVCAFVGAFLFTYLRSRSEGIPIWGVSARRLMWNTLLPMVVGGIVLLRLLEKGMYDLVAPSMLIFYGLALINGSKYTLGEIRYLGFCQLVLGIIGLWLPGNGLLLWGIGFGLLHIVYGVVMWWRYERNVVR